MRVLLTGAAGFVGSRVARALVADGHDVHAVLRETPGPLLAGVHGLHLERCDLFEPKSLVELVARTTPETCIHCAWIATPGMYLTSEANEGHALVAGDLARRLVEHGCSRIVGVGTCFEYAPSDRPLSEGSPLHAATPYANAKLQALAAMREACAGTTTSLAWARLFYLYGPGEDPRRLVPAVVRSLLAGQPVRITPGEQLRDFLHVDDVARALAAVATGPHGGPVNIGSGEPVRVLDLVRRAAAIVGRPDLVEAGALAYAPGDPMVVIADARLLRDAYDWTPALTLDDGLRQTIDWWRGRP